MAHLFSARKWLLAVVCCVSLGAAAAVPARPKTAVAPTLTDAEVTARANALLARMTPAEKAGQVTQYFDLSGMNPNAPTRDTEIAAGRAGALLFVADPVNINRLQRIAVERSRLKIPMLFGFDVVHGLRTIFPVPIAMAASWDPAMVERAQAIAAAEARAVGLHWTFAPMVDIARDPRWGRMVEGAGEDPYLGSVMAAAQVRGFQGDHLGAPGRIVAGPKHLAGYGASLGGRDYDEVNLSDSELWNVHLPPMKAAVDAGAGNIMSAYMALNGVPAAANRWLLTDVLRDAWGFKGFVVSDANAVVDLQTHGVARSPMDAAARAVNAGLDMEMATGAAAMTSLPAAMADGLVPMAQVDAAVRRVLATKIRMGLFDRPYVNEAKAGAVLDDPAHRVQARLAAERSAVLLRNDGGLLPLDRSRIKSIAVIGPLADAARDTLGPWVFKQNDSETITILAGLRNGAGKTVQVVHSVGARMPARLNPSFLDQFAPPRPAPPPFDDAAELKRAVELARSADVAVLVLGEGQNMIGENASRSSLDLPGRQQELLDAVVATGKPAVVLLMSGRPIDLKDSKAAAIMEIWYPGSQGGTAVANLLFGRSGPGGKLPFTWPRNVGQVPLIYSRLASHKPDDADKRYWNESSSPAYPFGFGLSYSSFNYSNIKVDRPLISRGQTATVTVDLRNSGKRTADEVAQLYIHQRVGGSARPVRELKGFQRVTLKPGQVRRLSFTLPASAMRYWSSNTDGWVQDKSVFDVWVGGDSAATLTTTFEVKG